MTCVSMGNPHAVFFCEGSAASIPLETIGPLIEHHNLFPQRINVHFVQVKQPERIYHANMGTRQRHHAGLRHRRLRLCGGRRPHRPLPATTTRPLPGGDLELNWSEADNCVYMTGPATEVFTGYWPK